MLYFCGEKIGKVCCFRDCQPRRMTFSYNCDEWRGGERHDMPLFVWLAPCAFLHLAIFRCRAVPRAIGVTRKRFDVDLVIAFGFGQVMRSLHLVVHARKRFKESRPCGFSGLRDDSSIHRHSTIIALFDHAVTFASMAIEGVSRACHQTQTHSTYSISRMDACEGDTVL